MNKKTIVIASDSFKGTLSSLDICHLYEKQLKDRDDISLITLPIADGGEGSLECISRVLDGHYIDIEVTDLYFHKIKTKFFIDNNSNAYIESASCVGLNLAHKDNDPGAVTTFGIGEQIIQAIKEGAINIYIFLGGTASNDGGAGLASALGTKFFNKDNELFTPTGNTLKDIDYIDNFLTDELLRYVNIIVLSDVKSPLFGVEGAAYNFAKQKGASDNQVKLLDDGLRHLANKIKQDMRIDIDNIPGSGAAGGLGGGLYAFTNAKITSGIDTLLDLMKFDEIIKTADLVISGEGKLDKQTLDGKVIDGIAKRCDRYHKDLSLVVGISEIDKIDIKKRYPCILDIYETNKEHLPFIDIKDNAKESYIKIIKELLD